MTEKESLLWNSIDMRIKDRTSHINVMITAIEHRFNQFIAANVTALNSFTATEIRDYVMGIEKTKEAFALQYIDDFMKSSIENNASLSEGTKKNYKKAIKHFQTFMKLKAFDKMCVKDLNASHALAFGDYLRSTNNNTGRIGMTEPSALGIIKKFRTIFDRAINENLLAVNPFKAIKLKSKSPRKDRLTISQLKRLVDLNLEHSPAQRIYRDIFLFSVYSGLAYKDAMALTASNFQKCERDIKLVTKREKTDVLTEQFCVCYLSELLERLRCSKECDVTGKILPQRSNSKVNLNLKMLSELANLPIKLTSHTARHTFRQLLAESGITDDAVIKRMMGQTRRGDIDAIYYEVTESRLLDAKRKFEKFLKRHL